MADVDGPLDAGDHRARRRHRHVHPPRLGEHPLVAGVVDPGHHTVDPELALGQQSRRHVGLVIASGGADAVAQLQPALLESRELARIGEQPLRGGHPRRHVLDGIVLDQQDPVPVVDQLQRDRASDHARARYADPHDAILPALLGIGWEGTVNLHHLYVLMLIAGLVLLASIVAPPAPHRIGLPSLLLFLGIGVLLGEDALGVRFDDVELASILGTVALAVILVEGGLTTRFSDIRAVLAPAAVLATVGVGISTVITAAGAHFLLGFDWQLSLLPGAIVSSTDAAALFSGLRVFAL